MSVLPTDGITDRTNVKTPTLIPPDIRTSGSAFSPFKLIQKTDQEPPPPSLKARISPPPAPLTSKTSSCVASASTPIGIQSNPHSSSPSTTQNPFDTRNPLATRPRAAFKRSSLDLLDLPPVYKLLSSSRSSSQQISFNTSSFATNALTIHTTLKIQHNDQSFGLKAIPKMKGGRTQMYQIESPIPLVTSIPNDQILIKLFFRGTIQAGAEHIQNYVSSLLALHEKLRGANLPIMITHNKETATTDGYFIVEKVKPIQFPLLDEHTPISMLSDEHKNLLKSIRPFFDFAWRDSTLDLFDLRPTHLGLRKNGELVLFNFINPSRKTALFRPTALACLHAFTQGNIEVHKYLCEKLWYTDQNNYRMLNEEGSMPVFFDPETLSRRA
ncbi:MAG: hypothetical protein KGZ39_04480 [Simkania sp.]|nr:hypothetical protein [Simkania sp.]